VRAVERAAIEAFVLEEMIEQPLLQRRIVVRVGRDGGRRKLVRDDINRHALAIMPREQHFPLRHRSAVEAGGQHRLIGRGGRGRREAAGALAHDRHHAVAILDVVVQLTERRIRFRLLPEILLDADLQPARAQIARDQLPRLAAFGRDGGKEDAEPRGHACLALRELRADNVQQRSGIGKRRLRPSLRTLTVTASKAKQPRLSRSRRP
jgi:hypothetical protein